MNHGTHNALEDPRNEAILIYINGDLKPRSEAKISLIRLAPCLFNNNTFTLPKYCSYGFSVSGISSLRLYASPFSNREITMFSGKLEAEHYSKNSSPGGSFRGL